MKSRFHGSVCVVGQGRWGSSLLAALKAAGIPAFTTDLRRRARPRSQENVTEPRWTDAEVFWLCVPDAAITTTAQQLAATLAALEGSSRGRVVLHSSGVYSSQILTVAVSADAAVASVHPLMSFPTRRPVPLKGVPFAVEAKGQLRTKLFGLVRALGGEPFMLPAEGKVLYHAAAVMASPLLVSLASAVDELARMAGLTGKDARAFLQPIMTTTLRNFFRDGAGKSFSGPFARGDEQTVSLHLKALAEHPELQKIYISLASHALRTLPVENKKKLQVVLAAGRK